MALICEDLDYLRCVCHVYSLQLFLSWRSATFIDLHAEQYPVYGPMGGATGSARTGDRLPGIRSPLSPTIGGVINHL